MIDKNLNQIRIGKPLKYIREKKDLSITAIAKDIISSSQLSRVEKHNQIPNTDSFIKLLFRLNISFEEFWRLSDDSYLTAHATTKNEIFAILRKKDPEQLKTTISRMDAYYNKYHDSYFNHMSCITKATLILCESNYDYSKVSDVLKPVSEYLLSIHSWFDYETELFSNCVYLYSLEEAIKIGNSTLDKIKNNFYVLVKSDNALARTLLLNLAIYSLSNEKYYYHAHSYSSAALSFPQSTDFSYNSLLAKIINQVACYKLKNLDYDEVYLANLINGFKLMQYDDLYKQCINFIIKHGITINNI